MPLFFRLNQIRHRTLIPGIIIIALVLSLALFFFWQRIQQRVEHLVTEQFNQQQLMLARKIADSIQYYFDFLETEMLSYSHFYQMEKGVPAQLQTYLQEHFAHLQMFGILEVRKYDTAGHLEYFYSRAPKYTPVKTRTLPAPYAAWVKDPKHVGKLFLTETFSYPDPPWQGHKVMALLSPLYYGEAASQTDPLRLAGSLELIFDPYYICRRATEDVRSGKTGYAWIIDQDGTFLAHYESDFLGKDAIKAREQRSPGFSFARIEEIQQNYILKGKEGTDWYLSGWHRERLGRIKKLIAYTPIRFDKGLIRGVTQVEDPDHNLWGVAVVAPFEEVYGLVRSFHVQEGLLVGFFFFLIFVGSGVLIGAVLTWNKTLAQEVEEKTEALRLNHERLLRSERFAAVGEAAAYVSHEIKNPLMVIGGFAHQLERSPQLGDQDREKLRIIGDEVKRLENFLSDLRDFTRPAAPAKQEVNVNEIVQEVQAMMNEAASEANIQIETELDAQMPRSQLDPNQIKQVLINLIKNGLEAIDGAGRITVTTRVQDGNLFLSVTDTGKGIHPEIIRDIFNPFFTTKQAGTGLGLSVINKIVEDHHGTITVESTVGRGSTFTVILPCNH